MIEEIQVLKYKVRDRIFDTKQEAEEFELKCGLRDRFDKMIVLNYVKIPYFAEGNYFDVLLISDESDLNFLKEYYNGRVDLENIPREKITYPCFVLGQTVSRGEYSPRFKIYELEAFRAEIECTKRKIDELNSAKEDLFLKMQPIIDAKMGELDNGENN